MKLVVSKKIFFEAKFPDLPKKTASSAGLSRDESDDSPIDDSSSDSDDDDYQLNGNDLYD